VHESLSYYFLSLPDPLSLMPGPDSTLSRCAPTRITESWEPSRVSAMMLCDVMNLCQHAARQHLRQYLHVCTSNARKLEYLYLPDTDTRTSRSRQLELRGLGQGHRL
jgi:hypothetical protein